ncbi:hypothetical protein FSP39_011712, partial [Pinctada imbricata]
VCKRFNKWSERLLNAGFSKVDKLHAQTQKHVKSQLPRRESERRNHTLARHVDILSAIETRLSLLGMTYMRYIDMGLCCFIPGKVLDELFRILNSLQDTKQPPRAHEFLQELRDISSMAMEHFEEKIAPALKNKMPAVTLPFPFGDCTSPESSQGSPMPLTVTTPQRGLLLRQEIVRLQNQMRSQMGSNRELRKDLNDLRGRHFELQKKSTKQEKKIQTQTRQLSDLSKKILEYDQKFSDLYSEISRMKNDSENSEASTSSAILPVEDTSNLKRKQLSDIRRRDGLKRKCLHDDVSSKKSKKS